MTVARSRFGQVLQHFYHLDAGRNAERTANGGLQPIEVAD
jgi:hypothetical protein